MPSGFLTTAEKDRLESFPAEISELDLTAFFTLTLMDAAIIERRGGDDYRLGFALLLCSIRYTGFVVENFEQFPKEVISYVAEQLHVAATLPNYQRTRTKQTHIQEVLSYLSFRRAGEDDLRQLQSWLVQRALEHDKPSFLLGLTLEKMRREQILRPGLSVLERVILKAREEANIETFRLLSTVLTEDVKTRLDKLSSIEKGKKNSFLVWLRQSATSFSADAVLENLAKIEFLRGLGVETWDLSLINPNRLKFLTQIVRKSNAQTLERKSETRRYPMLAAFAAQTLTDVMDETIDLIDRCLMQSYAKAGQELEELRNRNARSTNEKVSLLREIGLLILDGEIAASQLREKIYQTVKPEDLKLMVADCEKVMRPADDNYFDLWAERYSYFRRFVPKFLSSFKFFAGQHHQSLLEALVLLQEINTGRKRKLPADAPTAFIPPKWKSYVIDRKTKQISFRFYELCVLWELRGALRGGHLWVAGSRRYADPETYLIPPERWRGSKNEAIELLGVAADGKVTLDARQVELERLLRTLDDSFPQLEHLGFEKDKLVISPLIAIERDDSLSALEKRLSAMMPKVELADLLIEVDGWSNFSDELMHAAGREKRPANLSVHLYALLIAQSCNFGIAQMSEISNLSLRQMLWTHNWYFREETLKPANNRLVNLQFRQPLARLWGGGILSSSDGQRFPVSVKSASAVSLPKYFGYGRGITFYTWTSDQHSQYGTKVIPSTVRDATFVLDEILNNETELDIQEHTTDTAGYTDLVFGLFDLLGLRFSPRLRDLADQTLYRFDKTTKYQYLEPLLTGKIKRELVLKNWDDLLRLAASLKTGWATASLLIGKLKSFPQQNILAQALQEYGKINKTIFILNYLQNNDYRRRINRQLNKGEALHALRRFLFFANEGSLRKRFPEEQTTQAQCLNLVTNAIVLWNTVYLQAATEQLKNEGFEVKEEDLNRISPARFAHLNPYGRYDFKVEENFTRKGLRPLRDKEDEENNLSA